MFVLTVLASFGQMIKKKKDEFVPARPVGFVAGKNYLYCGLIYYKYVKVI